MFLLDIIPITKIPLPQPQILTYYTSHELKMGSLISVPLRKKKVFGVVTDIAPLSVQKLAIKKADYQLKNILEVISAEPILTQQQLNLALWMSKYYWCPMGVILNKMIPSLKKPAHFTILRSERNSPRRTARRQTLILVPQISQIPDVIEKINTKNHNQISIIHNKLTDKQYLVEWLKIKNGQIKFIIGTRSAVFVPFQNLSKIIIEQEENPHYKSSQRSPRFDARQTAIKLSNLTNSKLVFKSVTPRIETAYWAEQNDLSCSRFQWRFKAKDKNLHTEIIDMKRELSAQKQNKQQKKFSVFSALLKKKIQQYLSQKEQIILFINRRGVATFILCRDCGYILKCTNCDVPPVYHLAKIKPSSAKVSEGKKNFSNLVCHHCGHIEKPPSFCPACQSHEIKFFGSGTEKIEIEAKELFPTAEIARIDSDITKQQQKEIIKKFQANKLNILIGTQILLNQKLKTALTAIVSIDTLLHLPDFHSAEKIFQIIRQISDLTKKELVIQTYSPENYAIKSAAENNYKAFFTEEIEARRILNYPPFSQIIKLTYKHKNLFKAEQEARKLTEKLKLKVATEAITSATDTGQIFGPLPAFIPKKQGKYLWNIIIKLKTQSADWQTKLKTELLKLVPPDWTTDVDPENLL